MILVTGGAYAGKTDFAREHFTGMKMEVRYHEKVRRHLEDGTDPLEAAAALAAGKDVVVLLDEVGCGIVPMEASERAYREAVGRTGCFLAGQADEVWRVVLGIGTRIK